VLLATLNALSYLFSVPKVGRSDLTARLITIGYSLEARLKSLPKGVGSGLAAGLGAIRSDLQPDPPILGLARQLDLQNTKYIGL